MLLPPRSQHLTRHRAESTREPAAAAGRGAGRQRGQLGIPAGCRQAAGSSLRACSPPPHRFPQQVFAVRPKPFSQPKGFVFPEIHAKGCFCFVAQVACTKSCTLCEGKRRKKEKGHWPLQWHFNIPDWKDGSCPGLANPSSAPSLPYTPRGRGSTRRLVTREVSGLAPEAPGQMQWCEPFSLLCFEFLIF